MVRCDGNVALKISSPHSFLRVTVCVHVLVPEKECVPLDRTFHVSGCHVYLYLLTCVCGPPQLSPGSEDDDGEGPISEKLGRIQFSIGYSFQNTTLTVKVLRGQELPAKDFSGTSDPFVKIYLLPSV